MKPLLSLVLVAGLSLAACSDGELPLLKAPAYADSSMSIAFQRDGRDTLFNPTPYFYMVPEVPGVVWWKVVRAGGNFPFMVQITPSQQKMLEERLMSGGAFQVTLREVQYHMSLTQPGTGNVMLFLKDVVPIE